ncbi:MAG: zinc ribbon domain-containing protein, partial [Candidatus Hodarchaeales archaeon]
NYRSLDQLLTSDSFDSNEFETPITWENLSQTDILVLTDLEHALSGREIGFISDFHEHNGSILLATSVFPYITLDPYLQLFKALDLPIDFSNRVDLINFTDDGRERKQIPVSPVEVLWDSNDAFFGEVENLTFEAATGFNLIETTPILKHYAQIKDPLSYVLAGFEPVNKGKILILGTENWFESSFLSTDNGKNFISNIFKWIKPETDLTVNARLMADERKLELSVYSSSQSPLSVDFLFSNGTSLAGNSIPYDPILEQHHHIISLGEITNQSITISISNSSSFLKKLNLLEISPHSLPKIEDLAVNFSTSNIPYPSWADEAFHDIMIEKNFNVSITHTASSSVHSTLIISSQLEDTLQVLIPPMEALKNITFETELKIDTDTHQSLSIENLDIYPSGYYTYEIQIWIDFLDNSTIILKTERNKFFIPDSEPNFDNNSKIRGLSLDYYRNLEKFSDLPIWSPGESIELLLIGQDRNTTEFTIHMQFIHYYFWIVDRTVLNSFQIHPSSSNNNEFRSSFDVPDKPIPIPDYSDYSLSITNQVFALLIFIRDGQGNFKIEPILFIIGNSLFTDTDLIPLIILGLAGLLLVVAMIVFIQRSSRSTPPFYSQDNVFQSNFPSQRPKKTFLQWKFCNTCGQKVVLEAKFCSSCGSQLQIIDHHPPYE